VKKEGVTKGENIQGENPSNGGKKGALEKNWGMNAKKTLYKKRPPLRRGSTLFVPKRRKIIVEIKSKSLKSQGLELLKGLVQL